MERIKNFYLELIKDDEFKAKLAQFRQKNGDNYEKIIEKVILPEAKKRGYNFTKEELLTYENESGENGLSDEELLNVAGGFGKNQIVALSLGVLMGASAFGAAASNLFGGQNTEDQTMSVAAPNTSISQTADVETPDNMLDEQKQENQGMNSINNVGSNSQIGQLKGNTIEGTQKDDSFLNKIEEIKNKSTVKENEDTQATTPATAQYATYGHTVDQPLQAIVEEQMQQPQYASTLKGDTQATTPATVQYAGEETEKAPKIQHAERIQIEEEAPVLRAKKIEGKEAEQAAPVVQAEEDEEKGTEQAAPVAQAEKNEKQDQLWSYKNAVEKANQAKENYKKVCGEAEGNLDGKDLKKLTDDLNNVKKGLEEAKVELNKAKESLEGATSVRQANKKVLEINRLLNDIDEGIENSAKLLTRIGFEQSH